MVARKKTKPATKPRAPALSPEEAMFLQVIERASNDSCVGADQIERLIKMRADAQAETAKRAYDNAMVDAQSEMAPVKANAENEETKSKYASYQALDDAIRPIYSKHGFALSFSGADGAPAGHVRTVCMVVHRGGHREYPFVDMPTDGFGDGEDAMAPAHATASAVTYSKRYLLCMIFNIAIDYDDDGNAASRKPRTKTEYSYQGISTHRGGVRQASVAGVRMAAADAHLIVDRPKGVLEAAPPVEVKKRQTPLDRAKAWNDKSIDALSLPIHTPETLADFRRENAEQLGWMQDEAPEEFKRFEAAYTQAAEAAQARM